MRAYAAARLTARSTATRREPLIAAERDIDDDVPF
jgi:hypothetical protein